MNLLQKINSEKTNGTSYVSENRSNMFICRLQLCISYLIPVDVLSFLFQLAVSLQYKDDMDIYSCLVFNRFLCNRM